MYHEAVLLNEAVDQLIENKGGSYVDVTFGGGSHSREILKRLNEEGRLIAFDRDADSKANIINDDRFELVHQDFLYMKNFLRFLQAVPADGILADLGVSSHQFDVPERGFSYRFDAELDMRMNAEQEVSAQTIVNEYPHAQLTAMFNAHSDLKSCHKIAHAIIEARNEQPIKTTAQLVGVFASWNLGKKEHKFLSQLFQSIRMEVNNELESLKTLLEDAGKVLAPGGRLVVISYHSKEDKLVKNYFRSGSFTGETTEDIYGNKDVVFKPLSGKAIAPPEEEMGMNSRARSAKMRVGVRV